MGVFEMSNFENGTKKIGELVCKSTKNTYDNKKNISR